MRLAAGARAPFTLDADLFERSYARGVLCEARVVSYSELDPLTRETAERTLTRKQLDALILWEDGLGYGRIGLKLGISTSSARDRIHRALRVIELAFESKTSSDPLRESNPSRIARAA